MKKFFSLVLALVMALSLTTIAWGADIADKAALKTALTTGGNYALSADVTLDEQVVIPAGVDVTIDLNGKTLTLNYGANYAIVAKGNLTISGAGNVKVTGYGISTGYNSTGTVTVNGGTYTASSCTYLFGCFGGTITINAGVFAGEYCVVNNFAPYYGIAGTVVINNGEFSVSDPAGYTVVALDSSNNVVADAIAVKGGTFNTDVSAYVASTAGFVTNPDGTVTVGAKATTGTYDLYACNNTTAAATTGLSYTKVAASQKTDGTGTVAYVAVNNGKNYMEISPFEATKADFYLTKAGSTVAVMYLREVSTVSYIASAKEFTNFGYSCGQVVKQYGDTNKYYTVTTGAYKDRVFKAGEGGSAFLVGNKLVTLTEEVFPAAHVWSTTAVDVTTGLPTTAICAKCSTRGTVYATEGKVPASATIDPVKLTFNGVEYPVVVGVKTVVTPSTEKVQSAETFDAGIAMYVGMSVMAAAGSVVVLKKRED